MFAQSRITIWDSLSDIRVILRIIFAQNWTLIDTTSHPPLHQPFYNSHLLCLAWRNPVPHLSEPYSSSNEGSNGAMKIYESTFLKKKENLILPYCLKSIYSPRYLAEVVAPLLHHQISSSCMNNASLKFIFIFFSHQTPHTLNTR